MIGKKIKDPEIKTRYRKIAEYIAAAKESGEKLHSLWIEQCDTGTGAEDLDLAIREIEATQSLSNRMKAGSPARAGIDPSTRHWKQSSGGRLER